MSTVLLEASPEFSLKTLPDDTVSILVEGVDDSAVLKAVFLAGAGASGKSKVAADMFVGSGLKVINQDRHLEKMLTAANVPLSKVGMHYGLQKKAQGLKNAEMRQYGLRRLGMVIDSTGWDAPRILDPMKKLRDLGYDCYMVFVSTSLETALRRNQTRDRVVPPTFVTQAHQGSHDNLDEFRKAFGPKNVFVVKNDIDFTDATWDRIVAPALRKLGTRILKQPVSNPKGLAWLAQQKTATVDKVDAKEWPKTKPTVAPVVTKRSSGWKPEKWMFPSKLHEGLGSAPKELKTKVKLGTYDDCTVFLVDGTEVRQNGFVDFVGGGQPLAYPDLIPSKEIWVEQMASWLDTAAFVTHETTEYTRMKYKKEKYDVAHGHSNDAEALVRTILKKGGIEESSDLPADRVKEFLRGTKVVSGSGEPTLMYHGTTGAFVKFTTDFVGKGHDQEGPGLYFTSNQDNAFGYAGGEGGRLVPVYLAMKNPLRRSMKPKRADVERMIRAAPDFEESLTNWDEEPKRAFKSAVDAAVRRDDAVDAFQSVWYDFYRDAPKEFLTQMVKLGYDGYLIDAGKDVLHAVVFNPKCVMSAITKTVLA